MLIDRSSDEYIVRKVINGDVESFKLIVNRYQSHLYNVGFRFFKNEDDSKDFVQEVFLKIFKELKSYKGKASFKLWIIRIAYNYGINQIKAKKIDDVIYEESLSIEPTPDKTHIKVETMKELQNAIEALPEKYKVCVDLYFFLGFKYIDIKGITGYPVNTIKSNVMRAKQILRNKLRGSIAEDYHEM